MTARDALDRALVGLAEQGQRPRCGEWQDGNPWLSEDHAQRAQAARMCTNCPVLDPCGASADALDERFGVWAGIDRTRPTRTSSKEKTA